MRKQTLYLQQNIAFIRNHKRLTYKEFATAIGSTEGSCKSYELKSHVPPLNILCNIADFAGINLDALIREKITAKNLFQFQKPHVFLKELDAFETVAEAFNTRLKKLQVKKL